MVSKISIIGAGGVGSHVAYSLLHRLPPRELVLVDINQGLAQGTALDLQDTRGFLGFSTKISGSADFSSIKNSDIVVLTAGIARKKGMSRLDLFKTNAAIAKDISREIKKYAPKSIVIVVTNPLDIITYIVGRTTGFQRSRVMGMGSSLDTSRLFNIIHDLIDISPASLDGFVFGEHSQDMIVNLNHLKVSGQALEKFISGKEFSNIQKRVQLRGAEIVACLQDKSAIFAPGVSCACLIEAISTDSRKVVPVSVLLEGEYGLSDTCLGVPCVVARGGVEKVIEIPLTSAEKKELLRVKELFRQCTT